MTISPYRTPVTLLFTLMVFTLLANFAGCATNPVTGEQDFVLMSENDEIALGARYHQEIIKEMPVYPDQKLGAYVNQVGQRVASASHRPQLNYRFTVIDSTQVNAFALPGGYIYVTRGLLAYLNSEAELAAVLGHEVGHVTARHSVRQHSASTATGVAGMVLQAATGVPGSQDTFNILGKAMLSGYGREHELESDRLGSQYLARTGYDPQAMLDVIGVLKNQELFEVELAREEGREPRAYHGVFASHPENDRRLQEVIGEAEQLRTTATTYVGRNEFLSHMEGLAFGDSENDGVIRKNSFLHKPLDFGLNVPQKWRIENLPDQLLVIAPQGNAFLRIQVEPRSEHLSPQQYLTERGLKKLQNNLPMNIKGLHAHSGTIPVTTSAGQRMARVAALFDDEHVFLFTGVSRDNQDFNQYDQSFMNVIRSYRKLSTAELKLAEGLRLQLIKADTRTRFHELAAQSPIEHNAEAQLRLLNAMYPDGEPTAGELIKIVR